MATEPGEGARRGRRMFLRVPATGALLVAFGRATGEAPPDRAAFAARAAANRDLAIRAGDQPYGAVVVKDDAVVGEGVSAVVTSRDPAAHAERLAIRDAQRRLGTADLAGCDLYGTSRACTACEDAAFRARIRRMYHGADAIDAGAPRPL